MSKIQIDDVALHYERYGQGDDLILLHGNGEDLHYFDGIIPTLSQTFRVTAIDMRGHGTSEFGEMPLCFPLFAEDVARITELLDIKKTHLLGFSDGGNTAIVFALTYPDKVKTLILNGANLDPRGAKAGVRLSDFVTYLCQSFTAFFSQTAAHRKQITKLMVCHPHISEQSLHSIHAPTLVIAGEHDMIRREHTERIAENIKKSKLVILKNADHFLIQKYPRLFLKEFELFFGEQNRRITATEET